MTGDVALLDADNFITITGRNSRFSKIGGEMVPHLRVEEAIRSAATDASQDVHVAVTAVCDPARRAAGRVSHRTRHARGGDLPQAPSRRNPAALDPLARQLSPDCRDPALGTGKLDMSQLKEIAKREFCCKSIGRFRHGRRGVLIAEHIHPPRPVVLVFTRIRSRRIINICSISSSTLFGSAGRSSWRWPRTCSFGLRAGRLDVDMDLARMDRAAPGRQGHGTGGEGDLAGDSIAALLVQRDPGGGFHAAARGEPCGGDFLPAFHAANRGR